MLPQDDKFNRAKTLRFISRCHFDMNQIHDSLLAAKNSEELDPKSFQTFYILFKIYLKKGMISESSLYMNKMINSEEFEVDYLYALSQISYDVILKKINFLVWSKFFNNFLF